MRRTTSISRFVLATAAILAAVTAAQAYSDDAVRDAEGILRNVTARYQAGEVVAADLALARYNVLDMKQKAGQLDAAAFCRAAKPDLTAVVAALEGPAARGDAKQKWLDAIAGMDGDQAKCRDASAMAESLVLGVPPADHTAAALKVARDFAAAAAAHYASGEASLTDVRTARARILVIEYAAKTISPAAYCQTSAPLLEEIASGIFEESLVGQRSLLEVIVARRRLYAVKAQCGAELNGDTKAMLTLSRRGAAQLARKDFDAAIATLTELLRVTPQNIDALETRARAHAAKGDHELAAADYAAALALDAADIGALRERGDLRLAGSDYDGAIADYSGLLALEPDDLAAHLDRANAFYAKRDYAGAIPDYSFAIDHGPRNDPLFRFKAMKDALTHRAYAYVTQRDFDHAIADYTELLAITPREPGILRARAYAYYAKGDWARRAADLTALIELDPKDTDALIQRGAAYEQMKDYAHAIADDSTAIGIDPNNAEALNARCWHRAIGGHLAEALPDCDASLRLRPGDANTLDSRGFVRLMLGQIDGAVADYDAALKIDPKVASSLYGRGLARRKKGDAAGSDADVGAAKAIEPGIAERLAGYGMK